MITTISATRGGAEMKLTKREREVIELVSVGKRTKLIAIKLGISAHTVHYHLKNAMRRNDWHTRAQAAACLQSYYCR